MWTLQRPNKVSDKKWRINKDSKYSSLVRPTKKEETHPRNVQNAGKLESQYANGKFVVHHNLANGTRDRDPIIHQKEAKPLLGRWGPLAIKRTWLEKRPSRRSDSSSSSGSSDQEPYPRMGEKTAAWVLDARRVEARRTRLGSSGGTPPSSIDSADSRKQQPPAGGQPKPKPLQELNGREKYVQRYLASLQSSSSVAPPAPPAPGMEVVSRQKILSRSRDDLHYECEDEDVWYDLDQLVKEHIHEILKKWEQIDDGIWAKAIVFEKNRRVAKAYVRPPILTVNGSDTGFDGHRIGLKGFDNPMRDAKTLEVISRFIGPGVKIRMDNKGNIEVKKLSQYSVYVKPLGEDNAINDDIIKNQWMLETGKQMVFDISKFEQNVKREVRRAYPNRAKLETQCIMALAFAKTGGILQCPSWVMIINIVAMDMLRSKLPIGLYVKVPNIKNRPRLPVPEEDPYTLNGIGSGTSSGGSSGKEKSGKDKPPKLPPRDNSSSNKSNSKSDYDYPEESFLRRLRINVKNNKEKGRKNDDPYYCGLRARIPNFANAKGKEGTRQLPPSHPHHPSQMPNPSIFHSRSVDSGMATQHNQVPYHLYNLERNPCSWLPSQHPGYDSDLTESPYSQIYGRLPPSRSYISPAHLRPPRGLYNREWN